MIFDAPPSRYVTEVALDRKMRDEIEDRLLGLLDLHRQWPAMIDLTVHYFDRKGRRGSPGRLTTGLRDLLLMMEMFHAEVTGRGTRAVAVELAEEWQESGLWSDSAETLRRHYLRMCRHGPSMSVARAASGLFALRKPSSF